MKIPKEFVDIISLIEDEFDTHFAYKFCEEAANYPSQTKLGEYELNYESSGSQSGGEIILYCEMPIESGGFFKFNACTREAKYET